MSKRKPVAIPMVNDGDGGETGFQYLSDERDWEWFFHSDTRLDELLGHRYTPRGIAELTNALLVHAPLGRYEPVRLDHLYVTQQHAFSNPKNKRLQNTVDLPKFVSAARRFSQDFWLGFYVGGGELKESFEALPHETPEGWALRAEAAIAPLIYAEPDMIIFDRVLGEYDYNHDPHLSVVGGPEGGQAILIRRLQSYGIECAVEPTIFASAWWLQSCTAYLTDRFNALGFDIRMVRNLYRTEAAPEGILQPVLPPFAIGQQPMLQLNKPNVSADTFQQAKDDGFAVVMRISEWPEM